MNAGIGPAKPADYANRLSAILNTIHTLREEVPFRNILTDLATLDLLMGPEHLGYTTTASPTSIMASLSVRPQWDPISPENFDPAMADHLLELGYLKEIK